MMVAMCNLRVEYGHFTVKQTYENVLNYIIKVIMAYEFFLPSLYIAIRIMEDTSSCDGENINIYPWLN